MNRDFFTNSLKMVCEKHQLPGISVCYENSVGDKWGDVFGVRSIGTREQLQNEDCFRAGSTTKTLIAVLIMQMKEEGLLSLDDPVIDIIQKELMIDHTITIRHLLNHRSGLEDYLWVQEDGQPMISKFDGPNKIYSPWYLVQKGLEAEKRFGVDEGFHYSNTNYILLGIIIERLSERSIVEVMNENILKPLKMEQTFFPESFSIHPSHANGHSKLTPDFQLSDHIVKVYDDLNSSLAWTAGALISTSKDLNKFMKGLFSQQIVSKESLEEMTTFIDTGDEGQSYGLGMYQFNNDGKISIGHPGGISGYESVMLYYPTEGDFMTVMINQMPAGILSIAEEIHSILKRND